LLGVPRLLDAMRAHYGGLPSPDTVRPPAAGGNLLPAELRALRQGLLNVALSLLHLSAVPSHKAPRIAPEDIQARQPSHFAACKIDRMSDCSACSRVSCACLPYIVRMAACHDPCVRPSLMF
jgi:hypothetical protein